MAMESGLLQKIIKTMTTEQLGAGINVLEHFPKNCGFALVLSALLSGCGRDKAGNICKRLKTSNNIRKQVKWLVGNRQKLLDSVPLSKGCLKKWLAEPLFESLVLLNRGFLRVAGLSDSKLLKLNQQIKELGDEPVSPERLLNGHDLIKLGARPGPMVGQLIEELYLAQLETEVKTKTQAQKWVNTWLERHKHHHRPS